MIICYNYCVIDTLGYLYIFSKNDILNFHKLLQQKNPCLENGFLLPPHGTFKRAVKIDFSGGVQFHKELYESFLQTVQNAIGTFFKNQITLSKFARKYFHNLFRNMTKIPDSVPLKSLEKSVSKPILILGTGSSVEDTLEKIKNNFNRFFIISLDATVLENHGEYYFIWAEKVGVGKQISNLYIAKMESATKLSTVQVLLTTPDYDWERVGFWVNEGPAFIKHDGKIYMTYSASETGVAYCIGMLSADENDDLLDPKSWTKRRMPVLKTSEELKIYGPGHNSFTVNDEGEPVMIYHARTEAEIVGNPLYNPNRHAMVMKVKWNESGEPEFSYC